MTKQEMGEDIQQECWQSLPSLRGRKETNKDSRWTSAAASSSPRCFTFEALTLVEISSPTLPRICFGNAGRKDKTKRAVKNDTFVVGSRHHSRRAVPRRWLGSSVCFIVGVRKRWLCVNPSSCPGARARSPWLPPQKGAVLNCQERAAGPASK